MSRLDTAYGVYAILRISCVAIAKTARGTMTRAHGNDLLRWFGQTLVDRSQMNLVVERSTEIPPERGVVYMSNHQSLLDIPIIYAALPERTVRMIAKAELFKVPLWGQALTLGEMISIDRQNRESALESLERAAELIRSGVSVWIAPEGTRSRTGRIGPLKKGGFHLAKETGACIVPMAIDGAILALPPKTTNVQRGVTVTVRIGEPIEPHGKSVDEMRQEVDSYLHCHVDEAVLSGS